MLSCAGIHGWYPLAPLTTQASYSSHPPHPPSPSPTLPPPHPHAPSYHVGGVELSLSLPRPEERRRLLSRALEMGWEGLEEEEEEEEEREGKKEGEVIEGRELGSERKSGRNRRDKDNEKNQTLRKGYSLLKFDIKVPELWVPLESVSITMPGVSSHNYCYVQYKLWEASKKWKNIVHV